jgi:hypothetical protein
MRPLSLVFPTRATSSNRGWHRIEEQYPVVDVATWRTNSVYPYSDSICLRRRLLVRFFFNYDMCCISLHPPLALISRHAPSASVVTNLRDVQPDAITLDVLVTVMSLNLTVEHAPAGSEPVRAAEFTVADQTASIKLHVKNDQIEQLPVGALVLIRGCHISDFDGQMHLKTGPWSTITVAVAPAAPVDPTALVLTRAAPPAPGLEVVSDERFATLPDMSAVHLVPLV